MACANMVVTSLETLNLSAGQWLKTTINNYLKDTKFYISLVIHLSTHIDKVNVQGKSTGTGKWCITD